MPLYGTEADLAASWLSEDEIERVNRYRFKEHRHAFCAGRAFLRLVLAQYIGVLPQAIRFRLGARSKPELDQPASARWLQFSLARSDAFVMLAVAMRSPVGIDIERVRDDFDLTQTARCHFTEPEFESWMALPAVQRPRAFFALWTRKEAFLKGTGTGIDRPLDRLVLPIKAGGLANDAKAAPGQDGGGRWSIVEVATPPSHAAALATGWASPEIFQSRLRFGASQEPFPAGVFGPRSERWLDV